MRMAEYRLEAHRRREVGYRYCVGCGSCGVSMAETSLMPTEAREAGTGCKGAGAIADAH